MLTSNTWIWITIAFAPFAFGQSFPKAHVKVIGPIDYGQTSAPIHYANPPEFRAFEFNGKPGDHVEISVHSRRSAAIAFLTDSRFTSIGGGSAHFAATIPAGSQPATYYILVRDSKSRTGEFTVELQRPSVSETAVPEYLACTADSDCVAVDRAGCCHNGHKDAVSKSKIEDYRSAKACPDPHVICAMYMVVDDRVARCNVKSGACEMVQP